jgi:exocyst complex component 4
MGDIYHWSTKVCVADPPLYREILTVYLVRQVEFEEEPLTDEVKLDITSPTSPTSRRSRLSRYMDNLALRLNDSPYDLSEPNFRNSSQANPSNPSAQTLSFSADMNSRNPETDSFAYMEMLLESLAVLGRLGSGLDIVAQRVSTEIYNLVESTVDEVAERAEYGRRGSIYGATFPIPGRLDGVYVFASGFTTVSNGLDTVASLGGGAMVDPLKTGVMNAQSLRLSALESTAKQLDHETLRDFFWTLYSKLDAVIQGLRVIYEVANRIGSVSRVTQYSKYFRLTSSI